MTKSTVLGYGWVNPIANPSTEVGLLQMAPDTSRSVQVQPGAPAMFIGKPPPEDLQSLIDRNFVVGEDGRPWVNGEYALLPDGTECHWDGSTWVEGPGPGS